MRVRHFAIAAGIVALALTTLPRVSLGLPSEAATLQEAASPQDAPSPAALPPINQVVLSMEATELLDGAIGGSDRHDMALHAQPYYFPSLQGGTLTMLGFEVETAGLMYGLDAFSAAAPGGPAGEVAQMELFGALLQGGSEVTRLGGPFSIARGSGEGGLSGIHSFGDNLTAGAYELVWGVRDTISGVAATRRDSLQVPDLTSAGLTTSSIMVVAGAPSAAPGNFVPNTVYQGVRVLTATFPESLDRVLDRSRDVMLTYIVVGAKFDGAIQGFNLEVGYRILDASDESIWRVAPQPLNRPTVGQPIPLAQIEGLGVGSEYRFEISIKDLVDDRETRVLVPFTIAG